MIAFRKSHKTKRTLKLEEWTCKTLVTEHLEISKKAHKTWRQISCNAHGGTDRTREDAVLSWKTWRSWALTVGVPLICGKEKLWEETSLGPPGGRSRSLVPGGCHKHKQFGKQELLSYGVCSEESLAHLAAICSQVPATEYVWVYNHFLLEVFNLDLDQLFIGTTNGTCLLQRLLWIEHFSPEWNGLLRGTIIRLFLKTLCFP